MNPLFIEGAAADVAAEMASLAKQAGFAAAVALNAGEGLSVSVRNGEVETLEHHRDKVLTVTVFAGQRKGTATTTDLSRASLDQTLQAAAHIAAVAEPDPYAGLLEPEYLAREIPALDLDHPWVLPADEAITLALACENAAREAHPDVQQVDEAGVSHYRGVRAYADTQGFASGFLATRHGLNCVVVGARDGALQRGYWYSVARHADALDKPAAVGQAATARAIAKLGARKLTTRKAPVLFEARLAPGFIGHMVSAVSGGALYRDATFLRNSAGTQVLPSFVDIDELPHLPRGLGSAPFDSEGAATAKRKFVEQGVLTGYVLDSYSARRLKLKPTGNAGGIHNLHVSTQGEDFNALIKRMHRGLIVTDLMGHGLNLMTGDYSRGASGLWVEDGAIAYPVEEITIAGNLRDLLLRIVAIGNDFETRSTIRTGSILIEEMTIAGA